MKKFKYLIRDLDLLSDDISELESRLKEFGDAGYKLILAERFVINMSTYFRCVFAKEFVKNLDKDEIGYEDLFNAESVN